MNPTVREAEEEFDRLTDEAERAFFFARAAASEHGGTSIGSPHLVLGLLEAVPRMFRLFLSPEWGPERLQSVVIARISSEVPVDESTGIPFTPALRRVFVDATKEADAYGAPAIRPEHLLLGLLESEEAAVGELLRTAGIVRERIAAELKD